MTASGALWLRAGWLIDGQGGPIHNDRYIGIDGREIVAIHPAQAGPPHPKYLDLSHCTILPPLIDAHVHLAFTGGQPNHAPESIRRHLDNYSRWGIGAVRDGGDHHGQVLTYKERQHAQSGSRVRLAAAGWGWHRAGRYGSQIARSSATDQPLAEAIAPQLPRIDHLKIIQSGINSVKHFGRLTAPQFSVGELSAAVRAAHTAGLPVMVHANGPRPVSDALESGCDSIEHGYFMGEENLARMADRQITWVPTALPMAALAQSRDLSDSQKDVARRTLDRQMEQILWAYRRGVPLACGSDAGSPGVDHGLSVWRELALWTAAGLPLAWGIRCATLNAARTMRLERLGALLPGWQADWIAIPCAPEKILHVPPEAICIQGEYRRSAEGSA